MQLINYQGSKQYLVNYINESIEPFIIEGKFLLDICSGSGAITNYYLNKSLVFSNDLEKYAQTLTDGMMHEYTLMRSKDSILPLIKKEIEKHKNALASVYEEFLAEEKQAILEGDKARLLNLYKNIPTIWKSNLSSQKSLWSKLEGIDFNLFTTYYAGTYFGLKQAIDLDAIRYSLAKLKKFHCESTLLSIAFIAIMKASFSRDGHLAQPLSLEKNFARALKVRSIDIENFFIDKVINFSTNFADHKYCENSKSFNKDILALIEDENLLAKVYCVYFDPPYTDMQYSRYYHLLNTFVKYDKASPTLKNDSFTKGLYLNNRSQSGLSQKANALKITEQVMQRCKDFSKPLIISFAYPQDIGNQQTSRYLYSIDDLHHLAIRVFGEGSVALRKKEYHHSNQRNKAQKPVYEYLVECK